MNASTKIANLQKHVQVKNEAIRIAEHLFQNGVLDIDECMSITSKINEEFKENKRAVLFPGICLINHNFK
jgi:hypothetical protein